MSLIEYYEGEHEYRFIVRNLTFKYELFHVNSRQPPWHILGGQQFGTDS